MQYDVEEYDSNLVSTTLINDICPVCGNKVLIEKEKDYTPGFRYSCYKLKTQCCNCKIKVDYDSGKIKGGIN